jgi:hypothetical protein
VKFTVKTFNDYVVQTKEIYIPYSPELSQSPEKTHFTPEHMELIRKIIVKVTEPGLNLQPLTLHLMIILLLYILWLTLDLTAVL